MSVGMPKCLVAAGLILLCSQANAAGAAADTTGPMGRFVVLKPAPGEKVVIGSKYTVAWHMDTAAATIIELSTDGGLTNNYIDINHIPMGDSTYVWSVPGDAPPSDSCVLTVRVYYMRAVGTSSKVFSLVPGSSVRWGALIHAVSPANAKTGKDVFAIDGRWIESSLLRGLGDTRTSHRLVVRQSDEENGSVLRAVFPR